jgi:hypothetical protein
MIGMIVSLVVAVLIFTALEIHRKYNMRKFEQVHRDINLLTVNQLKFIEARMDQNDREHEQWMNNRKKTTDEQVKEYHDQMNQAANNIMQSLQKLSDATKELRVAISEHNQSTTN